MAEMPDDDQIIHAIHSVTVSDDIGINPVPDPDVGNPPAVEYEEGKLPGSSWTRR
jgi:hypothetical protein